MTTQDNICKNEKGKNRPKTNTHTHTHTHLQHVLAKSRLFDRGHGERIVESLWKSARCIDALSKTRRVLKKGFLVRRTGAGPLVKKQRPAS